MSHMSHISSHTLNPQPQPNRHPQERPTVSLPTPTHTSRAGDGHPTRTVTAKVTCVLLDDETTIGHPKYEITVSAERHQSWRFVVADAAPYPVGSTITLEVPA